jgi:cell division initiation protein
MTLSPAELRHERPGRGLIGYRRADVDRLLVEATVAYEAVWRERAELHDHVHELEQELSRHREGEQAMRNALVTAERAADEMRASSSRQAELIVREAEAKSRDLVHEAYAERERVRREMARLQAEEAEFRLRLRSLLGAILEAVRDHEERLAGSAERSSGATADTQVALPPPDDVVRAGG